MDKEKTKMQVNSDIRTARENTNEQLLMSEQDATDKETEGSDKVEGAATHRIGKDFALLKRRASAGSLLQRKEARLSHEATVTDYRDQQKRDLIARKDDEEGAKTLNEQADYECAHQDAIMFDSQQMPNHPSWKAARFEELLSTWIQPLLCKTKTSFDVSLVGLDGRYFSAEKLFVMQEKFRCEKKNFEATVGYHFTSEYNMKRIRLDGLLNRYERDQSGILDSGFNGACFGEGIYTCDEPISYRRYGSVGLLVVRLPGTVMEARDAKRGYTERNDSIMSKRNNILVLKESCQCLAAIKFAKTTLDSKEGERMIALIQITLTKLVASICSPCHKKKMTGVDPDDRIDVSDAEIDSLLESWPTPSYSVIAASVSSASQVLPAYGKARSQTVTMVIQASMSFVPPAISSQSPAPPRGVAESDVSKQKERFLIFTRVLMKYLEQKDVKLLEQVKDTIRDCARRHCLKESGYESAVWAIKSRLKVLVCDHYWKRAEVYLAHFLKSNSSRERRGPAHCTL